jgi:hypothetical protein
MLSGAQKAFHADVDRAEVSDLSVLFALLVSVQVVVNYKRPKH